MAARFFFFEGDEEDERVFCAAATISDASAGWRGSWRVEYSRVLCILHNPHAVHITRESAIMVAVAELCRGECVHECTFDQISCRRLAIAVLEARWHCK